MMAELGDVVFDATHPASLARFWAAALDGYAVAPYDEAELARLRANGIDGPEDDPSVLVESAAPGAPRLFFTLVPEAKVVKNRVHLDLRAADPDREAERLVTLGATRLARLDGWITMADPEGNEFDVLPRR
jgi:Glyoxalase-like domain